MPGKSRKPRSKSFLGKHKKTMKRRVKKIHRNRSNKYKKVMRGGMETPRKRYNEVPIPPPQTPQGQQPVPKETVSPKDKSKKEDDNNDGIQPTNLFL